MGLFSTSNAAKYRSEGLTLMQVSRLDASFAKNDFKRTLAIAGLAFMLVGSLSFIAVEQVSSPARGVAAPQLPAEPVAPEIAVAPAAPAPTEPQVAAIGPVTAPVAPEKPAVARAPEVVVVAVSPETQPPAAEPVAVATAVPSCVAELSRIAESSTIYFGVGSAQLSSTDVVRLSHIGRAASKCPEARIQVTGHSDTSGSDLINFDLSWKRADNTVLAIEGLGLDTSRFEPVGFGARAPVSEGDASDEDANRRVEFVVLRRDPDL